MFVSTVKSCDVMIVNYEVVHWDTLQFQWQLNSTLPVPVHPTAWYRNRSAYTSLHMLRPSVCTVSGVAQF